MSPPNDSRRICISGPATHQRPTGERENKGHDSNEQVFPEPWEGQDLAVSCLAKGATRQDPSGVQADWEPERVSAQARIRENTTDRKESEETGCEENWIAKLPERMTDRNKARKPTDSIARNSKMWSFQKMNPREKASGNKNGRRAGRCTQKHSED